MASFVAVAVEAFVGPFGAPRSHSLRSANSGNGTDMSSEKPDSSERGRVGSQCVPSTVSSQTIVFRGHRDYGVRSLAVLAVVRVEER